MASQLGELEMYTHTLCGSISHSILNQRVLKLSNDSDESSLIQQVAPYTRDENQLGCKYQRTLASRRYVHMLRLLRASKRSIDWNAVLLGACSGGHEDVLRLAVWNGADAHFTGLYNACRHGHRHMVEGLISNGAWNINLGLAGACRGGNRDVALLMISKRCSRLG
jgi:hypothetical protein